MPLQVPPEFVARFAFLADDSAGQRRRRYHSMVAYLDDAVGRVVGQLRGTHVYADHALSSLWDNTLVVFSSDK